jgi:predicted dehydrogenase
MDSGDLICFAIYLEFWETQVIAVSDVREDRLKQVVSRYPSVEVTTDFHRLLDNSKFDAIAVATPVSTHYELACRLCKAASTSW